MAVKANSEANFQKNIESSFKNHIEINLPAKGEVPLYYTVVHQLYFV